MKRILSLIERLLHAIWIAAWPSLMPGWFEEMWAGFWLPLINAVRRLRLGGSCAECEGCGLVHPRNDLRPVTLSDGEEYPECAPCRQFRGMIRSMHRHRATAA